MCWVYCDWLMVVGGILRLESVVMTCCDCVNWERTDCGKELGVVVDDWWVTWEAVVCGRLLEGWPG